jgi:2-oxoglutarate ferredoxin oxidoreductase subunit alpha
MMEPVVLPEAKEPTDSKDWAAKGHQNKRKHNVVNSLYIDPSELERLNRERFQKYEKIKETEQRAEEYLADDAEIILVAFGASSRIAHSAVDMARKQGIKAGLIRPITLWPFPEKFIEKHVGHAKSFLSVEMNMGQMVEDVKLTVKDRKPVRFFGRTGGIVPTPKEVFEQIVKINGGDC